MTATEDARAALERGLTATGVTWTTTAAGSYGVVLNGEQKLATTVQLTVTPHAVGLEAFVCRQPDENHEAVYRWLLRRNARLWGLSFAVDSVGDIYLVGRMPLRAIDDKTVDDWLGSALETVDTSFNTILEMGFAESIRNEWRWRLSRGEPTRNLEAFESLRPGEEPPSPA